MIPESVTASSVTPARTERVIAAYYFALFGAFGVYLPSFPPWLEARGITGVSFGVALALWPALGIVGPPLLGAVADAFSIRERILTFATFVAGISFAAIGAFATVIPSVPAIFVALSTFAVARSPLVTLSDALALETLGPRRTSYGKLRLFGSVGFMIAALSVGHFFADRGPAWVPVTVGGFFVAAAAVSLLLPRARIDLTRPTPIRWSDIRLGRRFLLVMLLGQAAHSAFDTCFALHAARLGVSPGRIGALFAIGIVAEICFFLGARRVVTRIGAERTLALGLAGAAIRWAATSRADDFVELACLQPMHALSFAATWAASIEIVGSRAAAGRVSVTQGVTAAAVGAGAVLGILGASAIYDRLGTSSVFVAASVIAAAAAITSSLGLAPRPSG